VLSGDLEEQQRVLAIVHDMRAQRAHLGARTTLAKGAELEADLDEYIASLTNAMSFDDADAVVRLSRFEDELARIRAPLSTTFDDILSRERTRRGNLRSAHSLAQLGQWGVAIGCVLGMMLVLSSVIAVTRWLATSSASAITPGAAPLHRERIDAAALVDRAVKNHRDDAHGRGVRLRYEAQLSITLFADRERIKHVVDSMLEMAVAEAQPASELVVHVASAETGVRFAIIEPGPGAETATNHDYALQLCSRIIEAHGGRLGIQSSSISRTYWFTLPSEPSMLR
jgi:signal transduction histidine kinase